MPEIVSSSTVAILVATPALKMLFGPSLEYFGQEIKQLSEKQVDNVKKILANACRKVENKKEELPEGASINPRVLRDTFHDGSLSDDPIMVEYFGGVLASSIGEVSRDDRGVVFNTLISRMSCYQLRAHYILYKTLKTTYDGQDINFGIRQTSIDRRIFIPESCFFTAMSFQGDENPVNITEHIIHGLLRTTLIGRDYIVGGKDLMNKYVSPNTDEGGLIISPTTFGIEFFLWAHGFGDCYISQFLDQKTLFEGQFEDGNTIIIPAGYRPAKET